MMGIARLTEEQADACIKYYGAGDESKRREMKLREQTLSCEQWWLQPQPLGYWLIWFQVQLY